MVDIQKFKRNCLQFKFDDWQDGTLATAIFGKGSSLKWDSDGLYIYSGSHIISPSTAIKVLSEYFGVSITSWQIVNGSLLFFYKEEENDYFGIGHGELQQDNWVVCLSTYVKDFVLVQPGPKKSGEYLCTCVKQTAVGETFKYLHMMEWDAEHQYWHDVGREHAVSHAVLAYYPNNEPATFNDFQYNAGGYLTEKRKED